MTAAPTTRTTPAEDRLRGEEESWVRGFRPDIEGLRALAVTLVVLYHAGLPWLPGGYIGVDVFFVLSGYLITTHLLGELRRHGRIDLPAFYARRIRRLLPLATLVTLATLTASWALTSTLAARQVATDALWTSLFAMNIHLARTGVDYQAGQDPSPLQHYWSLAIEEQFYLAWPLIITAAALLWTRRRTTASTAALLTTTTALTTASFAYGLHQLDIARPLAYFTTPSRAWELGIGGILAITAPWIARRRLLRSDLLALTGLATIIATAVLYDDTTTFPGTAALAPTLATAAVLVAGTNRATRTETHLLDKPLPQALGKISYGLYLWHWPILILTPHYLDTPDPSPLATTAAITLALWLSTISFFGLEQPTRVARALRRSARRTLSIGLVLVCVTSLAGLGISRLLPDPTGSGADGTTVDPARIVPAIADAVAVRELPANLDPAIAQVPDDTPSPTTGDGTSCMVDLEDTAISRGDGTCVFGDPSGERTVVLAGDSHAYQWLPALERIAVERGWRVVSMTKSGCPLYDVALTNTLLKRDYVECYAWRDQVMARIRTEQPDQVLLSAFTGSERADSGFTARWATGVTDTVGELRGLGTGVTVLADTPYPRTDVPECLAGHLSRVDRCTIAREVALSDLERRTATSRAAMAAGAQVIDPTPWFCTRTQCPTVVGTTVLYSDNSHMSASWSLALRRLLADELGRISPDLAPAGA